MPTARYIWFAVGTLIVVILWTLSLIPHPPAIGFRHEDKLYHVVAYGGTMWWWGQCWRKFRSRLMLAIFFTLMGVAIEFIQGWTGWRTFDPHDMLANGVGVLVGWALLYTPLGSFYQLGSTKKIKTTALAGVIRRKWL